jgi:hypothetical protein
MHVGFDAKFVGRIMLGSAWLAFGTFDERAHDRQPRALRVQRP